jgi:uncharacterized membrane protein
VGLVLWTVGYGTLGLLFVGGSIIAALALLRRSSRETLFVAGLALAALCSLALPEVVAVKGDVGRMNTVFKFYLQAWILLAILAGPCAVKLGRALFLARPSTHRVAAQADPDSDADDLITPGMVAGIWRYLWAVMLAVLVLSCAVYPVLATRTKVGLRFEPLPPTLDGMAYMAQAEYQDRDRDLNLPSDWAAIRWMMENVEGTPVILEGTAPLYHWGSRFSIYTGLPTVIGWDWHQKQQRWGYQERVEARQRDVNRAYESQDPAVFWNVVDEYDVQFVVVGGLERAYYPAAGLAKLDRLVGDGLEVAYQQGSVTIYRVTRP